MIFSGVALRTYLPATIGSHHNFARVSLAALASPRFSSQKPPSTWRSKERSLVVSAVFFSAALLLSCSTALVTENTLDVATTTDDLYTRQIIFNLVKIKQNQYALPSQVQIPSGYVTATTTINPAVSAPLAPMIATTIGSSNTSAAITDSTAVTRPAVAPSLSGTATNNDNWNTTFLQDPQQLRRLRLLYQYGAEQIGSEDLLCRYPVPEKPQAQQGSQSQSKSKSQQQSGGKKRRYVRVAGVRGGTIISCRPPNVALVGDDPDPAFLNFPDCIICAFPNRHFDDLFKQNVKNKSVRIYKGAFVPEFEDYNDNFEYIEVVLNNRLAPNSLITSGASTGEWNQKIDWLSILQNGVAAPTDAKRIGTSDGYTVYVHPLSIPNVATFSRFNVTTPVAFTGEEHFSEYVLAIMEALLQPAELQKTGATPPPIVQR
jgi:hypothetical protein